MTHVKKRYQVGQCWETYPACMRDRTIKNRGKRQLLEAQFKRSRKAGIPFIAPAPVGTTSSSHLAAATHADHAAVSEAGETQSQTS